MKTDFTPRLQMTGAIAGIALSVGSVVYGEVKKGQANKKAKALQNSRPVETPSPYTKDELALTQSELAGGMGADASRFYKEQQDEEQSNSLDAILKGGGDVNNVAKVFSGGQAGNQRLTLMKENLRLNQINNFVNASRNAEQGRQQEFQFNQWAPWADETQANAAEKQGAEQTISSGIGSAAAGITGALSSYSNKKELNNYFNTPSRSSGSGPSYGVGGDPNDISLSTGGYTPNVAGSVGNPPEQAPQLNYNFNNSSNSDIWNTPGNS